MWVVSHELTAQARIDFSRNSVNFWLPGRMALVGTTPSKLRGVGVVPVRYGYGPSRDWRELALMAMETRQRMAMIACLQESVLPVRWWDGNEFPEHGQLQVNEFAFAILPHFDDARFILYYVEDMTVEENETGDLRIVDDFAIAIQPRTIKVELPGGKDAQVSG